MKNTSSKHMIEKSWEKISPTWPLQNIIACNPLQGFENLDFFKALEKGNKYFQQTNLPKELEQINQISIKWFQMFFDKGQSTIAMPNQSKGLYQSWKELAIFDVSIHQNNASFKSILQNLPSQPEEAVTESLKALKINNKDREEFTTLLLTSLNGWSSYVKYLGDWQVSKDNTIKTQYLAIRLILTRILWPNSQKELISWFNNIEVSDHFYKKIEEVITNESTYQKGLISQINKNQPIENNPQPKYDAQLVFCIDVRSEPFRKSLESCGKYDTYGFAGFFGIPTSITNELSGETYASCPVLLSPSHNVVEKTHGCSKSIQSQKMGYVIKKQLKKTYQSLKYNFTSTLPLAEALGFWSGLWMMIRTLSPKTAKCLKDAFNDGLNQNINTQPDISCIPFEDQCNYALNNLKAMGMVDNFAKIIVFCGHGSHTQNNAFATSLDCGACAGRHGDSNAKILAQILNQEQIRDHLAKNGITIPISTLFIAAKHNTTTDEVTLYDYSKDKEKEVQALKTDLLKAKYINNQFRAAKMGFVGNEKALNKFFFNRSNNWSEVQPEWGLAQNGAFIVGPRDLTKNIKLDGRAFLHSYNWKVDEDCAILNLILNAPMVVAQWINCQYLFSTLDNTAFGSGNKITQNIVGKIGAMQGNSSDLMHGLPSQSVNIDDKNNYHKPQRLSSFVYAPAEKLDQVISQSPKLQELFKNKWVHLFCVDPHNNKILQLDKNLKWVPSIL